MNSYETCGFSAMCGAVDHEMATGEKVLAVVTIGGFFALIAGSMYLEATGKIKPAPVYYGPGYYPAYYPTPAYYQEESRPGVTFNF